MGETLKKHANHGFTQFELLNSFVKNLKHFKLSPNTKWVIAELITHYNPLKADIFPKQKTIAENLGVSEASVIRAISQLHKEGLIISERKYTNRYKFTPKFLNLCGLDEKIFTPNKLQDKNKQIESNKLANCYVHEHEQIKEQINQQKELQSNDKYLLKYAEQRGVKNKAAYINAIKRNGGASNIINDLKQAEINRKVMQKITKEYIKNAEKIKQNSVPPTESWKKLGEKLREMCNNS